MRRRPTFIRTASAAALALAAAIVLVPSSRGEVREAQFELPANQPLGLHVDVEVAYPGVLSIDAVWGGSRVIAFRLEGPGDIILRRTGPSPQRIEYFVDEGLAGKGQWRLVLRGLAAREGAQGLLTFDFPEPPDARPAPDQTPLPPLPPPEAWKLPRQAPAGAPVTQVRFYSAVEAFRSMTVDQLNPPGDACRWREDFLRFLGDQQDLLARGKLKPDASTRRMLERLAVAARRIEEQRTSDDPLLAGPAPKDRAEQHAWAILRGEKIAPVIAELDDLRDSLQRGHAPELEEEDWPLRFVACVTACQRHFEERTRLGPTKAINTQLARDQWPYVMAAADALGGLVGMWSASDPAIRLAPRADASPDEAP